MVTSAEGRKPQGDAVSMIDGIPLQAALLDGEGRIVAVNAFWRRFAAENGYPHPQHGLGLNYVETCRGAAGAFSAEARVVAADLQDVLSGARDEFSLVYPCHSPTERRWFRLIAYGTRNPPGAVILHLNITPEMLEEERQAASRVEAERALSRMEQELDDSSRDELQRLEAFSQDAPHDGMPTKAIRTAYRAAVKATTAPTGPSGDAPLKSMTRAVAESLATQGADANTVARLHTDALGPIVRAARRDRRIWVIHEARMVFIGVLGHLANIYRGR